MTATNGERPGTKPGRSACSASIRSLSPLAAGASPDRLLAAAGRDGDLVRLGPIGLRQRDADDAVLEGGLRLSGVDLEGEGDSPLELPGQELTQVPRGVLTLLAFGPARHRAGKGQGVIRVGYLELLRAHSRDGSDDDRLFRRGIDIER